MHMPRPFPSTTAEAWASWSVSQVAAGIAGMSKEKWLEWEWREAPRGFCGEGKESSCSCLSWAAALCNNFLHKSEKHYSGIEILKKKKKSQSSFFWTSNMKNRLWFFFFFKLWYNSTLFFFDLKNPKNRLHTFPNRNCMFCVI